MNDQISTRCPKCTSGLIKTDRVTENGLAMNMKRCHLCNHIWFEKIPDKQTINEVSHENDNREVLLG